MTIRPQLILRFKPYAAMVPVLVTALQRTGTRQVLELCSGAGVPWPWLHPALAAKGLNVSFARRTSTRTQVPSAK